MSVTVTGVLTPFTDASPTFVAETTISPSLPGTRLEGSELTVTRHHGLSAAAGATQTSARTNTIQRPRNGRRIIALSLSEAWPISSRPYAFAGVSRP